MAVPSFETSPAASTAAATKLKREDFGRTKHDSAFSQWKILIGASDWEDHSMGKEGAEKYRTQNLPNCPNWTSCPGVYELGIATSCPRFGSETRKFDSSSVVPVYLGQADNLKTRLQQYGRDGAHLENGCSNIKNSDYQSVSSHKGPGLFTDIFSRGLPIVYRCAPMESKKDAEIMEKQLLDKFDYAWNKGSNGARRQDDICKKLDRLEKAPQFSLLPKKFLFSNQREVGINIRTGSNSSDMDNITRVLGIRRLQPRQEQYGSGDYCNDICGVSIGHGSVCTTPPVAGRKRCATHKGLSVNSYISKLNTEGKVPLIAARMGSGIIPDRYCSGLQQYGSDDYCNDICGVSIGHGSVCTTRPVAGRKRCAMHKGLRVNSYISKLNTEGKVPPIAASMGSGIIPDRYCSDLQQYGSRGYCNDICGVSIGHGSVCTAPPVAGRKRCAMHKGLRVNSYISKLNTEGKVPLITASMGSGIIPGRYCSDLQQYGSRGYCNDICGVSIGHGSVCTTPPVAGRKRCAMHKGLRV